MRFLKEVKDVLQYCYIIFFCEVLVEEVCLIPFEKDLFTFDLKDIQIVLFGKYRTPGKNSTPKLFA